MHIAESQSTLPASSRASNSSDISQQPCQRKPATSAAVTSPNPKKPYTSTKLPTICPVYLRTLPPQSQHGEECDDLGMSQLCTPELEEEEDEPAKSVLSHHQTRRRARNVIFGESGAGKSSVINALAQDQVAATSDGAAGCTFRYQKHEVDLSGMVFILFDTVGLDEGTAGTVPAAKAEANLKSLLRDIMSPKSDGICLLVYCVRCVKVSRALFQNYNLVYSTICRKKVPIVIVVTGLENQEPTMDSW